MARVKFIRDEEPNIRSLAQNGKVTDGALYIATDTGSMWMGTGSNSLLQIKDNIDTKYVLPKASTTVLGGVKVGNGLSVSNEGLISLNIPDNSITADKLAEEATLKIDSELSTTSTNAVQNKIITNALNNKSNTGHWHATHTQTVIAEKTDLDTLMTPGWYFCPQSITVTTLTNCPTQMAFGLEVLKTNGVVQTLYEYDPASYKIYTRQFYNGTWGSWGRIYTTRDTVKYAISDSVGGSANFVKDWGSVADNVNVQRPIWISDSVDVTKRLHDNNFTYNSVTNTVTANITGKAATAGTADTAKALSDGVVTTSKIVDKAVTDAKINTVSASKITGTINSANLPSYVDDVLEYTNKDSFPKTGEAGKIYVDTDTNLTYRWSGSGYVEISPSLALGTTASTAFPGDRGQTAYEHSQKTGNPHNTTINDISNLQSTLDTKVPNTRKVNNKALSTDITLTATDVGAAASSHTHNYAGSSSAGGSADSAKKLDTTAVGAVSQPVYFANGIPVAATRYSEASVKYAETAGSANSASVANSVAWDNITGAPAFPDISNCVTVDQLKTILASATIDSTGKLTFTV